MTSSRSFRDVSVFSTSEAYLKLTRSMIPGNCRLSSKSFVGDPRQIVDTFDYKESLTRSVTHLTGINLNIAFKICSTIMEPKKSSHQGDNLNTWGD
jgi:hypothetical protein